MNIKSKDSVNQFIENIQDLDIFKGFNFEELFITSKVNLKKNLYLFLLSKNINANKKGQIILSQAPK